METEATELLDKAVALWESLDDDISDVPLLLQSILVCARIYQLLKKVRLKYDKGEIY